MERRAERNGTERNETERNGNEMERKGSERKETEWSGMERKGSERNGTKRNGMERNGTEHNGKERNSTRQRNATLRGLVHTCPRSLKNLRPSQCAMHVFIFSFLSGFDQTDRALYSYTRPLLLDPRPPHGPAKAKNLRIHLTLTLT